MSKTVTLAFLLPYFRRMALYYDEGGYVPEFLYRAFLRWVYRRLVAVK